MNFPGTLNNFPHDAADDVNFQSQQTFLLSDFIPDNLIKKKKNSESHRL